MNRKASLELIMADLVGRVVMPGDKIEGLKESESTRKVILGPGLRTEGDSVFSSKPGILQFRSPNVYWIDTHQKRVRTEIYCLSGIVKHTNKTKILD